MNYLTVLVGNHLENYAGSTFHRCLFFTDVCFVCKIFLGLKTFQPVLSFIKSFIQIIVLILL